MAWFALLLVMVGVVILRVRWLSVPLERDEGEYAYMGQLMLRGIPPFREAYNMKLPGTHASYALIEAVVGQSVEGLRVGFLLVDLATIVAVFWLGRILFGARVGVWSAVFYAAFSQSPALLAPFGHATHFINLCAVPGVIALLRARESRRLRHWFSAGSWFGLAVLMKQQALFLAVFALLYTLCFELRQEPPRRTGPAAIALIGGILWPLGALSLLIWWNGNWSRFWYWVVDYGMAYTSQSTIQEGWYTLAATVSGFRYESLLWALAVAGCVVAIRSRRERVLLVGWFGAALVSAVPGLYFREHYFIPLLPVASLLGAVALVSLEAGLQRRFSFSGQKMALVGGAIGVLAVALVISPRWELFFRDSPDRISRRIYGENPFPEAREVGRYIAQHSTADQRIAVLGSEPQIYFYAKRRSATGYLYTYPLMEIQPLAPAMNREMAEEIEKNRPEWLVWAKVSTSWLSRPKSENFIFDWFERYSANYHVVAVAELWPNGPRFVADPPPNYQPATRSFLLLWRKNLP